MIITTLRRAALLGFLFLFFAPLASASAGVGAPPPARGGVIIYDWGDTVFEQGPLPDSLVDVPVLDGYKAGYLCNAKGIFWSDVVVSDCQPVAFKDNTYTDAPEVAQAVKAAYPDMHRSVWNQFGWILIVLGVVLLIALKVVFGKLRSS